MNAVRMLFPLAVAAVFAAPVSGAVPAPQAPVPALSLPSPVERTLPNGLRVVVFESRRLPIVQLQLLVPAGSGAEAADQPGVAALTTALLRRGTPSRSAEQLAGDFSQLGATLATSCTRDYVQIAVGARAESFEGALEVMSDAVINPLFGGDEFAAARDEEVRRGSVVRGSLADAVDSRLGAEVFGPHPYAHEPAGDPAAIARLELPVVQAFHRDRWRPDRSVLVIAGDVTADRAFAVASDWFGRWGGHAAPERARPAMHASTGVRLVDSQGSPRAEVRVAVPGPGLASPDHDSWALVAAALENTRLPEGAHLVTQDARDASLLVLSASVPPAQAVVTTQALVKALKTFAAAPLAGDALAAFRRRVAQHYPLTIGTLGAFVSQWQALDNAGAPAGSIATLGARQAAADPAAGLRALAAAPVVLVAGPVAQLRGPLQAAGLGAVSVDSVLSAPGADAAPAGEPTAAMRQKGQAAIAAAITAHGGSAALGGVHSLVVEGTMTLRMAGQDMSGQFSAVRQDPDRYSFATKILNMESRQMEAGGRGWGFMKSDSTRVIALDSAAVSRLRAAAGSDLVHELRQASLPGADPVWRGTEPVAGRACDVVEFATPWGRQRMAMDAQTHRVVELASGQGPRGTWLDRRLLSDFRQVNGVLFPWVEERSLRGERVWRMDATAVGINREIPQALFERPVITP
jgi:zinc protease